MKQEKTKSKKRLLYYLILLACVILLVAATVLTVYFVTQNGQDILENPPVGEMPDDPVNPKPEPSKPSGGETARFVAPLACTKISEYEDIYHNTTVHAIYRHMAVDIAAEVGDTVSAMGDGVIESISYNAVTGNIITISHGDDYKTVYRFVEPIATLKVGQRVSQGEIVATVAEPYGIEAKEGAHLHLEMYLDGKPVDPTEYLIPTYDSK